MCWPIHERMMVAFMKFRRYIGLAAGLAVLLALLTGCAESQGAPDTEEDPQEEQQDAETGDNGAEDSGDGESEMASAFSGGLTEEGFLQGVTASEIVTLPQYKGIEVPQEVTVASSESMEAELESILANYTEYQQVTDRPVMDGDTVNIDYVGSVDGVEFEGGSTQGAGTTVTIGVTSYIDDFLEQLIGHTPGENFDIEVTFPDPYQNNPDLAGKDAIFNITINYIQGDAIERELDDEIAADYGYSSADELLSAIERDVVMSQQVEFTQELLSQTVCEEVPESVMDYFKGIDTYILNYYGSYYGMTGDEYVSALYGYEDLEAYLEAMESEYRDMAVATLAVQAIAEIEGLQVTVDDIAQANVESYIDVYGEPYVKNTVLNQLVIPRFIVENAG